VIQLRNSENTIRHPAACGNDKNPDTPDLGLITPDMELAGWMRL